MIASLTPGNLYKLTIRGVFYKETSVGRETVHTIVMVPQSRILMYLEEKEQAEECLLYFLMKDTVVYCEKRYAWRCLVPATLESLTNND